MVITNIHQYVTEAFSSVRSKSKRRGDSMPTFSKEELRIWLYENNLEIMWSTYVTSGYLQGLKPSIDRIDDYGVYSFNNMQLITWKENNIKGVNGQKHHNNTTNHNLKQPVFIWNKKGDFLKECKSAKEVSEYLGCHLMSVSRGVTKERKTTVGYVLTKHKILLM